MRVCVCMCVHICVLFTQGLCLCTQGTHACTPSVKGMLFVQVCVSVCVCERMPVCGEPRGPLEGPGPSSQGGESHFWLLSRGVTGSDLASRPTEGAISAWALAAAPRPLAPRPRTRQSSAHKAGSRGCKERGGGAAELGQGDAVGISLGK